MKFIRNLLIGLYINIFLVILLFVLMFKSSTNQSIGEWTLLVVLCAAVITSILSIIFGVINIINTYKLCKDNEYNSLRKYMKVLKFGAVPYFIINFIVYFFIFFIFLAASRGIILFTPIPLIFIGIIFFTYLAVIFTSSYGIDFLVIVKKEKIIKTGSLVIHILLQLCFVLDVVDTLIILMKYKSGLSNKQVYY